MASRPLLGRGITPASARAAVALAALAVLAACVCAALLAGPGAPDELYLPLAVSASPRAWAQSRLGVDGSTMLVTSPSMSSVLGAREAQVEEDADAEDGAGAAAGEGAESDADRVREQLGEKEDEARAASRYGGDDNEDGDLAPQTRMPEDGPGGYLAPADEDGAAKSDKGEDEYVDDIDIPARHSLAASRGRDVPLISLTTHSAPPATIEIKPYDPAATVSLTQSEWRSGSCQNEGYTHELKSQTGPTCPAFQALTEWKETHNGCHAGQMKTEWKCASVQVFKSTLYIVVLQSTLYILWYQKYSVDYSKALSSIVVLQSTLYILWHQKYSIDYAEVRLGTKVSEGENFQRVEHHPGVRPCHIECRKFTREMTFESSWAFYIVDALGLVWQHGQDIGVNPKPRTLNPKP